MVQWQGAQGRNCRFKKDVEANEQLKANKAAETRKKKKAKSKAAKKRKMKVLTKLLLLGTYLGQLEQLLFQILLLHRKKGPPFWKLEPGARE